MVQVKFINMTSFNASLNRFVKKQVPGKFNDIMAKIVFDIFSSAARLTPVVSGTLRGGWQVGRQMNDSEDGGGESAAYAELGAIQASFLGFLNKIVFIYNNVEYAEYVEFGTPKMAPRAMLTTAIQQVEATL